MDQSSDRAAAQKNIIVLVDADNIQSTLAKELLSFAKEKGEVCQVRCFGRAEHSEFKGWAAALKKLHVRLQWEAPPTDGSNATDITLTIAAVDLVRRQHVGGIVLASRDHDFGPLLYWLKEQGTEVWTFPPPADTPEEPRPAATKESTLVAKPASSKSDPVPKPSKAPEPAATPKAEKKPTEQDTTKIVELFERLAREKQPVHKGHFGNQLKTEFGDFPYKDINGNEWRCPTDLSDATGLFATKKHHYFLKSGD